MARGQRAMSGGHLRDAASRRKEELRAKGPLSWNVVSGERGPRALAFKNHLIAMIGEYVGTVLFMIFALGGTNVALIPNNSVTGATTAGQGGEAVAVADTSSLLYIALSFGFSLAVNAWIFFRVSGGLFNPAVSLGMVLVGALTPIRGALLSVTQILGGITGAAIIQAITPGTLNVRTQLGGGTSIAQGLFIEMFLTSLLMLAILLLAAEKHKATFIAPIGIGLALFVAELLGVYYTGGSLNPARSFGPAVVLRTFSGYHWIYWVGPGLGAIIAAGFYKLLKFLQYETVLGPETDETGGVPKTASGSPVDEEKAVGGTGPTAVITGPGLGDLLTIGNREEVFDLEHRPGPLEDRLVRIENMLERMLEREPRPSDLTHVEPASRAKGVSSTYNDEKYHPHPHGGMAAQSVATTHSAVPINAVHGATHGPNGMVGANSNQGYNDPTSAGNNIAGRPNAELGPTA